MAASARAPPRLTAWRASRSSSPLSCAALRFIQMIIEVTNTTATPANIGRRVWPFA